MMYLSCHNARDTGDSLHVILPVPLSPTHPCLHDTTTGGVIGAGKKMKETGIGIRAEIETVIHGAGAAALAVRDGVALTRDEVRLPISCTLSKPIDIYL
jgi:hypothetical protein